VTLDEITALWTSGSEALMSHPSASFGMWPSVQNNLDNARVTLQRLHTEIQPVVDSGNKKNFFFKVQAKSWKLGLHVNAISTCLGRVSAHHKALEVAANMMRLWVCSPFLFGTIDIRTEQNQCEQEF
jgi:hypothetical protein